MPIQDPLGPLAMYRNDGRGNFVDVTDELGIRFGDVAINGWSFGDSMATAISTPSWFPNIDRGCT